MLVPRAAHKRPEAKGETAEQPHRFPASVETEISRLLDAEARRLLSNQLDGDAVGSSAGGDQRRGNGKPDELPLPVKGQPVPIRRAVDNERRAGGS
jgi:hypothetical protein